MLCGSRWNDRLGRSRRVLALESIHGKAFRPDWAQFYRGLNNTDMKTTILRPAGTFPFDHTENPDPNCKEAHTEVWAQQTKGSWSEVPHIKKAVTKVRAAQPLARHSSLLHPFCAPTPKEATARAPGQRCSASRRPSPPRCGALSWTTHVCVLFFLLFAFLLGSACPRRPTSRRSSPRCSSRSSFAAFHHQEAVAVRGAAHQEGCRAAVPYLSVASPRDGVCAAAPRSGPDRGAITCSGFTRARGSIKRLCFPVLQLSPEVKDLLDRILVPKEEDRITIPDIEAHRWCVSTCFS